MYVHAYAFCMYLQSCTYTYVCTYVCMYACIYAITHYVRIFISHKTGKSALPDIYVRMMPSHNSVRGRVRIYQAKHACLCYNYI